MARQRLRALRTPRRSRPGRGPQPRTAGRNWRHPAETELPSGWPPERDYSSRQPPLLARSGWSERRPAWIALPSGRCAESSRGEALRAGEARGGVVRPAGRVVSARGRRLAAARASGGALAPRVRLFARLRRSRSACPSLAGKMAAVRRARSYSRCVVRFSDRELC